MAAVDCSTPVSSHASSVFSSIGPDNGLKCLWVAASPADSDDGSGSIATLRKSHVIEIYLDHNTQKSVVTLASHPPGPHRWSGVVGEE